MFLKTQLDLTKQGRLNEIQKFKSKYHGNYKIRTFCKILIINAKSNFITFSHQ